MKEQRQKHDALATALIAQHGPDAVEHVAAQIEKAVRQSDDDTVFNLDKVLRAIENRIRAGDSVR